MKRYCKIIDENTGLVRLGAGCSDEYYKSIGMKLRNVEQSEIDGQWYLSAKCPHYTNEEKINIAKADKYAENDIKAKEARYNQEFTITVQGKECVFDTSEETQRDLLTAYDVCATGVIYDGWTTNNCVELDLSLEDIVLIFQVFKEKSNVYGKWKEYKQAIDKATTIKKVEAIVINYEVSNDNDI